jgi:hypothetical protein
MEVFGAPLSEADAKAITEYLATTYGSPKSTSSLAQPG